MPKRICLCFDGTWNTPSNSADLDEVTAPQDASFEIVTANGAVETNVSRLYRSIRAIPGSAAGATAQVKWYDKGVATDWYDRIAGGAFGLGLSRKIREGY